MNKRLRFLLSATLMNFLAVFVQGQLKTQYYLYVSIDPSTSTLDCKSEIRNPGDACFYLTKSLRIKSITADGKKAKFHQEESPNSDNSYQFIIEGGIPEKLIIECSGLITLESFPPNIGTLNMIKPGLIELSDHINWFPRMKGSRSFIYKMDLRVPKDYVTITNSSLEQTQLKNDKITTLWKSEEPVYGITLVSAPDMHSRTITANGMTIEIYYSKLPLSYIDSMKTDLIKSMERLTDIFGSRGLQQLVRVVYSPRSAGGYARAPLILVSENYAMEQLSQKFGFARDFRLNTHEIAHYWSKADASTSNDWINEGLAEYSALLVSEKIIGKEFSDLMVNEYSEIVKSSPTEYSIAETPADSRDREVNRYYKPALLLNNLKQKFGEERMKEFLKSLYKGFSEAKKADTPLFLDILEKNFGKETRDSIKEALYRKTWEIRKSMTDISYSPADTAFIGKWTGPLTQFGATVRFVLNLNFKDGKLVPSLDSPDQNVTGIPLSDLILKNDSISFKIGVASASYKGHLDRNSLIISGEFMQRGGTYSLNLAKEMNK